MNILKIESYLNKTLNQDKKNVRIMFLFINVTI